MSGASIEVGEGRLDSGGCEVVQGEAASGACTGTEGGISELRGRQGRTESGGMGAVEARGLVNSWWGGTGCIVAAGMGREDR